LANLAKETIGVAMGKLVQQYEKKRVMRAIWKAKETVQRVLETIVKGLLASRLRITLNYAKEIV